MKQPCVIVGSGGHAAVLVEAMRLQGEFDPVCAIGGGSSPPAGRLLGVPIVGGDENALRLLDEPARYFAVGIGSVGSVARRKELFELYRGLGFEPATVVHPQAIVSPSAEIGPGSVVLAGAVVGTRARVGENVVLNTSCIVEHDCTVGPQSFLAPGAKLAGCVTVDEDCFIGIGAAVIQEVSIGRGALIGAGAIVLRDVPAGERVVGVYRPRGAA